MKSQPKSSSAPANSASGRSPGRLYLCATPIGNLEDITLRVLATLRAVAWIAAEDTRRTQALLRHFGVETPLVSYHDHNEASRAAELLERLRRGEDGALVCDAGTPLLSDPGYPLVRQAIDAGIAVVPLPGPSAVISALIVSGLPPHPFYFGGFLPRKGAERERALVALAALPATLVFYEAPHRLAETLEAAHAVLGDRPASVARELTKLHEEVRRGTLSSLAAQFREETARGECVLVIQGASDEAVTGREDELSEAEIVAALREELAAGRTKKEAIKRVASSFRVGRNLVYRISLDLDDPAG